MADKIKGPDDTLSTFRLSGLQDEASRLDRHLLSCIAEECAEIIQRITKAQRFGIEEVQPGHDLNNRARLNQEINDLIGVLDMFGFVPDDKQLKDKQLRVMEYIEHAKSVGAW